LKLKPALLSVLGRDDLINTDLDEIEDSNKEKLDGVFRNIDFNSEASLGQTKKRNNRLKSLLEDFKDPRLEPPPRLGRHMTNAYLRPPRRFGLVCVGVTIIAGSGLPLPHVEIVKRGRMARSILWGEPLPW
jgi:hypothetical protein